MRLNHTRRREGATRPGQDSGQRAGGLAADARGVWAWRDRPGVFWLIVAALITLVHPFLPGSRWLMVHLVVLGALTHSILVWSTHFTQALLKTDPALDSRRQQSRRLALLAVGTTLVLVGVPTARWPLTLVGAILVVAAVTWHALQLARRLARALPGRFRVTIAYYLLAAAWLVVGATLGAILATGPDEQWHGRLLVAHSLAMGLGWVGHTVIGTLVTLWPTMLRTRMDLRADPAARQALPLLTGAVALIVTASLLGLIGATVAGLLAYLAALAWWARPIWACARSRGPREFATASVGMSLLWWVIALAWVSGSLAVRGDWVAVADTYGGPVACLVVGFAVQLLTGALSYLIPMVIGGGPSVVRAGQAWFDRWAMFRLVTINVGLILCLLPVPSLVRVLVSTLVLVAILIFIPLLVRAIRAARQARRDLTAAVESTQGRPARALPAPSRPNAFASGGQAGAALGLLALLVSLGVGLDPSGGGSSGSSRAVAVRPTGQTTTVRVEARDMHFVPAEVTVPLGNRLVIELVNTDPKTTHDLVLGNGAKTARLSPGASATLDAGVIGESVPGWCSIVGHRQMGMTFQVTVPGQATSAAAAPAGALPQPGSQPPAPSAGAPHHGATSPDATLFGGIDPVLAPLPAGPPGAVHRVTLRATELELEVAAGVWQRRWTFSGRAPGPTLHGRVGDIFEVTLINDGSMGHSIDFHAGALAPDRPMRTIAPGQQLVYRFTAQRSGIWMYHCSTMPMSAHIAAGMHGAVVIEPPNLPPVDLSYLLVQSEVYLGASRQAGSATEVDADKVQQERPDLVVFNGIANQYDQRPLTAKVGQRVRIWVLNAGPNRASSFHIVGGQFDSAYAEGVWLLRRGGPEGTAGSQALSLAAAQGGFVELAFPEAGRYPMVSHVMVDAERGAHGIVAVS